MGRWLRRFDVWVWTAAVYALLAALAPLLSAGVPAPPPGAPGPAGGQTDGAAAAPSLVQLTTPILRYRSVTAVADGSATLTLARLEEHLEALKADGIAAVGLGQVLAALEVRAPLPEHAVALTFDAGLGATVTAALPALARRQMRATFFVSPRQLGQPGSPTASQVQELAAAGMDIAPLVAWRDGERGTGGTEALAERLMALRGALLGLGAHPLPLAALTAAGPAQQQALALAGYRAAVTERQGALLRAAYPYELPVTLIEGDLSVDALRQAAHPASYSPDVGP